LTQPHQRPEDRAVERWPVLRIVRALAIALVLAAIVVQAKTLADANALDATRFFAYFTIQSNLIGVAVFVWLVARDGAPRGRAMELVRAGAAAYLTVTFFVVIALLSKIDVGLQLGWVDVVLHKIFPVIIVLDWLLDPPQRRLVTRDAAVLIVYPLIWTGLTMVRGSADGWYPYPFLNPANGGYGQVLITAVAMTIGFVLISAGIIWLGNWRRELRPQPLAA